MKLKLKPGTDTPRVQALRQPAPGEKVNRRERVRIATAWMLSLPAFDLDNRRPLKIGISKDLNRLRVAEGIPVSHHDLKNALTKYCKHPDYQAALVPGTPRIYLDGAETDDLVVDHD